MSWLHAAQKGHDKDENTQSRYDSLDDDDPLKSLPDINVYIKSCFHLTGICSSNDMGIIPISWVELNSFINCSAYPLTGWESEQIIMMSRDYCSMHVKAQKIRCAAPYLENMDEEERLQANRDRVARQWDALSDTFAKKEMA